MQVKENSYFVLASEIGESGLKQKTGVDRYLKKMQLEESCSSKELFGFDFSSRVTGGKERISIRIVSL